MTGTVALVSGRPYRDKDSDLPLTVAALDSAGVDAEVVCWDDPAVEWARFDGTVVFSTWDYVDRRDEFLAWAERAATATVLANPPEVLRWNTDKRYLADLEAVGVPVVPTRYLAPGDEVGPPPWPDLVVKPTVSAGARLTGRFRKDAGGARAFAGRLLADGHHVMVQPYLDIVDSDGEVSVCVFGGAPSHALTKRGVLRPGSPPAEDTRLGQAQPVAAADLADAPLWLVDRVLGAVPGGDVLYARIDCALGPDGSAMLMEAELTEPHFFFSLHPDGADRFAAAVTDWLS